jgi:hypothetical protein
MQRRTFLIFGTLLLFYVVTTERSWPWPISVHERLATIAADSCVELPKPKEKRCNSFVDDNLLLRQSLRYGSILPDVGVPSDPSHDYNPSFDSSVTLLRLHHDTEKRKRFPY